MSLSVSSETLRGPAPVLLIGAGRMGGLIARRLLERGIALHVFDPDQTAVARCVSAGATAARFERVKALDYEKALLCLPDPAAVRTFIELWLSERPRRPDKRSAVADLTTVAPGFARNASADLATVGISYLDAPVSGGEPGAASGDLAIMVGGSAADFEALAPLLEHIGNTVRHVGAAGTGSLLKAINQYVYLTYNYVFAQGLRMAREAGLPQDIGLEILRRGAAGHPLIDARIRDAIADPAKKGFPLKRCLKDLGFLELGADIDPDVTDIYRLVRDRLQESVDSGKGELDILALSGRPEFQPQRGGV